MYDAFGNLAAEYGGSAVSPCGVPTTCYLMTDHLGSTRLMTDNVGSATNVKRYDYLPFGEEIVSGVNGRSTSMGYPSSPDAFLEKFTGQARDPETANVNSMTGLDWMRARYYSSSQGRFQSVDPANAGAMVGDPQSWNGYAYVGNNPLNYRDPSGTILEATTIGAATGNPIGVAVGLGVDVFCALFCGKLFGGSPSLPTPKITGNGPEVWSERAPISGGGVNTGGTYGRGCGMSGICSFGQIKSASTAAAFSTADLPYLPPLRRSTPKIRPNPGLSSAAVVGSFSSDERSKQTRYRCSRTFRCPTWRLMESLWIMKAAKGGRPEYWLKRELKKLPSKRGAEGALNWKTGEVSASGLAFVNKDVGGVKWGPVSIGGLADTHGNVGGYVGIGVWGVGAYGHPSLSGCKE